MVRAAKTPRYDAFNTASIGFGIFGRDPKQWRQILDPEQPLTLEVGCGKAELSLELAQKYTDQNFIGIDMKADRLWRAVQAAQKLKLDNVAFIQADALQITEFVPAKSVGMIWLTHPDPYPKDRHAKRRLAYRPFLDVYKTVLFPGAPVRLKTDNHGLFTWVMDYLAEQPDVQIARSFTDLHAQTSDPDLLPDTAFSARYRALGQPIYFAEFTFTN